MRPLRILIIVNLPWDVKLGATRVWMELAKEWRAAGATVEHFTLSEAFPTPPRSRASYALREVIFARRAAAFVRANADRFDVIDALIGALPFSREQLRFNGLLVARSVGLYLLYEQFERSVRQRWPGQPKGKLAGRAVYGLLRRATLRASERSVRHASLINVPNETEASCLRGKLGPSAPLLVQPYGLSGEIARALRDAAAPPATRHASRKVCFVGMWSPRKGARDWPLIIRRVLERVPDAQFSFLGTMVDPAVVRAELGTESAGAGIEVVAAYQPEELPRLLADCTVGAFPSYIEGFGLAVIEQLAAAIPTVAYDTAGPRDILGGSFPEMLTPAGDIDAFAAALTRILLLNPTHYAEISARSLAAAAPFTWAPIADATLTAYGDRLIALQQSDGGGSR